MPSFPTRAIPPQDRSIAGFTLVEVLTIVSVIVGLSSLMLPVLSRARDAARTAICGANLRQMSQALNM